MLISACLFASCSVIRTVQVDSPTTDCVSSGQHFCHQADVRTSIWKQKNKSTIGAGCPNGISRLKVTTKPMDVVLGFITAGFVLRQRIEWDCAQRTGSVGM